MPHHHRNECLPWPGSGSCPCSSACRACGYVTLYRLLIAVVLLAGCCREEDDTPLQPETGHRVAGRVIHDGQPVSGARVKIRATGISTLIGQDGAFRLDVPPPMDMVTLTAWSEGYYIGGGQLYQPGDTGIMISLAPFSAADNKNYRWVSAYAHSHSGSAANPRFRTMYAGTDVHGNCAACHAPLAAIDAPYGTDPLELAGTELEGISCDFCHKIMYARILREHWTEKEPAAACWMQTMEVSNSRIRAFDTARADFSFAPPAGGSSQDRAVQYTGNAALFRRRRRDDPAAGIPVRFKPSGDPFKFGTGVLPPGGHQIS